ncbi:hypothetical protein LSAT2_003202 [Lamellibrachia satsuma]|nr:hypothetical protein LSAT2_003202 [Lamellibrachia satsuma]
MVSQKVIRKVVEHTDWCLSLTFTTEKDGSICVCLDPKRLNDGLKRCPPKMPTVRGFNPEFANGTFFSKLDAKAGYWAIHLDEESQLMTTFRTQCDYQIQKTTETLNWMNESMELEAEDTNRVLVGLINFPVARQVLLREETTRSLVLNRLKEIVHRGWHEHVKELSAYPKQYWFFRDELAIEYVVLLKGRHIVVPEIMQYDILGQLHERRQGVEKTRLLARDCVYWLNIKKLALADEIRPPVTSQAVTDRLKMYCALFGRLDKIMRDIGPQYNGQPFKRATAVDTNLRSPGEMLLGRPLVTLLPSHSDPGPQLQRERQEERRDAMKRHHNQTCGDSIPH